MGSHVPEHLQTEKDAVEAEIRAAFKDVTREGGTSWNEAWAIDVYQSEEQLSEARAMDREKSWEDLVDDQAWDPNGMGPWSFMEEIGQRYYMAPRMIRDVREGGAEFSFLRTLEHPIYEQELKALLTPHQRAAVNRYLQFMIAVDKADTSGNPRDAFRTEYRAQLLAATQRWLS